MESGFYCLDYGNRQDIYYWDGKFRLERYNLLFDCWTIHPAFNIEALKACYDYLEFEILYLGV
jgi:hypothetical protein